MFRKASESVEMDLFYNPSVMLGKRGQKIYEDPHSWHRQFYTQITSLVDEEIFRPMYNEYNMGTPNREVRVLVGMIALKEGVGCSDEHLFERCTFDILYRHAIGLFQLDVDCPCAATYYNFRRHIGEYEAKFGINLYEECFKQITKKQVLRFKVNGKSIRMDSKLIGSNIAWYNRYQIVQTTFCKSFNKEELANIPEQLLREKALEVLDEDSEKTVYRTTHEELEKKMLELGILIHALLGMFDGRELLRRVFFEHFAVDEQGNISIKPKDAVPAKSVQNPNDPDASFRKKAGTSVKGYTTNITETHDQDDAPNLVVNVQVKDATVSDNKMLQSGVEGAAEVTGQIAEKLYADGAYQSDDNRAYTDGHQIDFVATGLQGKAPYYDFTIMDNGELNAVDKETGEQLETHRTKTGWAYKASGKNGKMTWRYIQQKAIDKMHALQSYWEGIPPDERRKRNNVEATIFQYCFLARNNKTRYRGLFKQQMQAFARCLWMNMRRIMLFQIEKSVRIV